MLYLHTERDIDIWNHPKYSSVCLRKICNRLSIRSLWSMPQKYNVEFGLIGSGNMIVTKELLDELTAKAKENPRLRMAMDLRNSAEDQSQRMLALPTSVATRPNMRA